ncbi:MAG: hypothetical protein WKF37_03650 [Bryobacteraceae bacterium]
MRTGSQFLTGDPDGEAEDNGSGGELPGGEGKATVVRLFQTGESTNFLVLTRQNEYADSRRREVVAS